MDVSTKITNVLTGLGIFVGIALGIANSEVRAYFGIEDMTKAKFIILTLYILICYAIWSYGISPLIPRATSPFLKINNDDKNKLIFSNMSIDVSENGDITLRTVINMLSNGLLKPVKKLMPNNFKVHEELDKESKEATVLGVTPMESASQITILIDASESMWGETTIKKKGKKLTKMEVAKESIISFSDEFINSQRPNQINFSYISFMVFSGQGIFLLQNNSGSIWFPAIESSKKEIANTIKKIQPEGNTPMYSAVDHAIDVLSNEKKAKHQIILCLTDGIDNASSVSPEQLSQKIQSNNIPIITIGYGLDSEIDENSLNTISTLSGAGTVGVGSFSNIEPKQLSSVFEYILNNINNTYELRWKSNFPKPGKHINAKLQATYDTVLGKRVSPVMELNYTIPNLK